MPLKTTESLQVKIYRSSRGAEGGLLKKNSTLPVDDITCTMHVYDKISLS